ncbi:sno oncogene [Musca autumnalis]|uniref:sno oncogene n=1 Tax=Musca autumnalis TaxID=221902 RepID=UPI003CF4D15E
MTEYVTPNIHTVLKKYQTSAPKSLQGPGHSLANIASTTSNALPLTSTSSVVPPITAALAAPAAGGVGISHIAISPSNNLCTSAAAAAGNCPLDVSLNNNGGVANLSPADVHGLVAMRTSPCDLVNKSTISGKQQQQNHTGGATATAASATTAIPTNTNPALPLIKKEIMTSPEPIPPAHDLQNENPLAGGGGGGAQSVPASMQTCGGLPPQQAPSIKIMPPPPPEVSQPILSAADPGTGELYETRLEGKTIGCFSMGGEMRLCLPQFLNNVLAEFSLEQINRSFDDLGIFCSQCTPEQLMEFKAAKILPSDVKSSGLITRTDAERLCAVLLHRSDRNSYINVEDIPKGAISFKVYHRCFGKCEGICTPDMYSYQKPTCIMCLECKGWFSPQKFVGHVHRKVENRTCHWGFDSRNWHDYLHVALDVENREKYQKILDELKEVEIKEQQKAQQEINYLKRKAELHLDHSILVPSMGLGPHPAAAPPPPQHQPLPPSMLKHRGDQQPQQLVDIPTTKKTKGLDEASAAYQLEYQHYQSLMYAHCAQQQRMAAAGQMSAFRPWPQPKTFMHAAYNAAAVAALSTLPYLSQEPPVLQNPERVVRSTDRERFERTYQPNVALAPRKTHLAQEREKEQRELRERERMERERELERERMRERERSREREREYERERELRERKLQQQIKQQHHQQQQQQQPSPQTQVSSLCGDVPTDIQIKQERAPTPNEMSNSSPTPPTPPPLNNHHHHHPHHNPNHPHHMMQHPAQDDERRSNSSSSCPHPNHPRTPSENQDDDTNTCNPLMSPLSLGRSKGVMGGHLGHLDAQRRLSLQNSCNSSNSSLSASSTSNAGVIAASATTPPAQKVTQQHVAGGKLCGNSNAASSSSSSSSSSTAVAATSAQSYMRQSPSPNRRCNSASCTNSRSPEEFGGSNEITSSTSPMPQQQHHNAQNIIATVNHHSKLLPSSSTFGANSSRSGGGVSGVGAQLLNHNEMPGRIRISKNLLNQNNIIRSPTPPMHQLATNPAVSGATASGHHQQHHPQQHHHHHQQYEYYKHNSRFYGPQQQQHPQHRQQCHQSPQPQQQQQTNHQHNSPSQSSNASPATVASAASGGLNLTTNATSSTGSSGNMASPATSGSQDNSQNCIKPPAHHMRMQTGGHMGSGAAAFMQHASQLGGTHHAPHHHQQLQHQSSQQPQHTHPHHNFANGRRLPLVAMNSEFELSTDTDDESVNDGEPDSSNSLTPWELAIEALRDSRPKERERLLNMLQRMLNENQHYRLQNQQLKELIVERNEQISKLQSELQHCQRQLSLLQLGQQPSNAAANTMAPNGGGGGGSGSNGLITKALRKETLDDQQQLMLRVPLKKSQRREPESFESMREERTHRRSCSREREDLVQQQQQEEEEKSFQSCLKEIKRELSESMEEDEEVEEDEPGNRAICERENQRQASASPSDRSRENMESCQTRDGGHLNEERHKAGDSESEHEEDEEEGEEEKKALSQSFRERSQSNDSLKRRLMDSDDEEDENEDDHPQRGKRAALHDDDDDSRHQSGREDNDAEEEEEECDGESDKEAHDDEVEERKHHSRVQAPHSNAINTPPTATTPHSPDSAATAGQLFDSSNSSDESSMKKAQMSASNALAKMNSEINDEEEEGEDDEEGEDNPDNEREENRQNLVVEDKQHPKQKDNDEGDDEEEEDEEEEMEEDSQNSLRRSHSQNSSDNEEDEGTPAPQQQQLRFRLEKNATTITTNTSNHHLHSNNNSTTTVVLATKASKKLTPTTNNDIKIKQEYL